MTSVLDPLDATLLAITADAVVGGNPAIITAVKHQVPGLFTKRTGYVLDVYYALIGGTATSRRVKEAADGLKEWAIANRTVHAPKRGPAPVETTS